MNNWGVCLIVIMIFFVTVSAAVSSIPSVDAIKVSGTFRTQVMSASVCGDALCDEPMSIEEKIQMYLISLERLSIFGFGVISDTTAKPTVDFENCGTFLFVYEVKMAIDYADKIEETEFYFPKKPLAEYENACLYSFTTPVDQSQVISVMITAYKSAGEAFESYNNELDHLKSLEYLITAGMTTGDWKQASVENNVDDQRMILSQKDKYFLYFYTESDEQFADVSKLRDLSTVLRDKIDGKTT